MTVGDNIGEAPRLARTVFLVLGPFACGYFLSYLFRSVNAVLGPDLVRVFSLSAGQLGLAAAGYSFAFALFQLPLGLLLDRYGPRRVQAALLCCSAFGALHFSQAWGVASLTFASALIGFGFAGGLMAGFKAVTLWVRPERIAFANGCIMAFGALGTVAATIPANWAAERFGWRAVFEGLTAIVLLVAAFIFFAVPECEMEGPAPSIRRQLEGLAQCFASRPFLRVAPLAALCGGGSIAVQSLWVGPWLRDVGGFNQGGIAYGLFFIALTFSAGILLSGLLADLLARRGIDLLVTMVAGLLVNFLCMGAIVLGTSGPFVVVWLLYALTGQIVALVYAHLSRILGRSLAGRSNTGVNSLVFASAFLSQWGIGWVIDRFPQTAKGYDPAGYRAGFGLLLMFQLLALAWFFLLCPRRAKGAMA
jgi:predicted MFS family arabinose efflux permease